MGSYCFMSLKQLLQPHKTCSGRLCYLKLVFVTCSKTKKIYNYLSYTFSVYITFSSGTNLSLQILTLHTAADRCVCCNVIAAACRDTRVIVRQSYLCVSFNALEEHILIFHNGTSVIININSDVCLTVLALSHCLPLLEGLGTAHSPPTHTLPLSCG